jgi:F-type H+-transporting ATPase subunit delta
MTGVTLRLTDTYARVLFGLASEEDRIDAVRDDLLLLLILVERDPEFIRVLVSPYFSPDYKRQLLYRVFSGRITPLTLEFLVTLVRHRRTAILQPVVDLYSRLWDRHNGLTDVTVTLAKPPDEEEIRLFSQDIESALSRQIRLKVRLDPKILGGIVIRYDDRVMNNSLRGRLDQAVRQILQTVKSRAYEV